MNIPQTQLLACNDFTELAFTSESLAHVRGYTIDIENVLTDGIGGGDPTVREDALSAVSRMRTLGKQVALLTNCSDMDFLQEVADQIQPVISERPLRINPKTESKLHRRPFDLARRSLGVRCAHEMAHIDDQLKSHVGAWSAGYSRLILTKPYGEHQHEGVRRTRFIESGAVSLLLLSPRGKRI